MTPYCVLGMTRSVVSARAFAGREQALREFLNREQLFTGDVSHELRTPLTILQGGVEILESRLGGEDT